MPRNEFVQFVLNTHGENLGSSRQYMPEATEMMNTRQHRFSLDMYSIRPNGHETLLVGRS